MMGVYGYVFGPRKSFPVVKKFISRSPEKIGPRPFCNRGKNDRKIEDDDANKNDVLMTRSMIMNWKKSQKLLQMREFAPTFEKANVWLWK